MLYNASAMGHHSLGSNASHDGEALYYDDYHQAVNPSPLPAAARPPRGSRKGQA